MDIDLSEYGQQRHFAGVINLRFTNDSGWSISYNEFLSRENTHIRIDSSRTHFGFWIDDFAIPWRGEIAWRPANVADLSNLEITLSISSDDFDLWKKRMPHEGWCPVKQVDVYVNNMSGDNLLFTAPENETGFPSMPWSAVFRPVTGAPFTDSLDISFRIDPLWLRNNILSSLE